MQIHNRMIHAYFCWSGQKHFKNDLPERVDIFDFKQKIAQLNLDRDALMVFDLLAQKEEQFAEKNIQLVFPKDVDYPQILSEHIEHLPVFCVQGSWPKPSANFLTVVGCRQPSVDSLRWMKHELPEALKIENLVLISGAARGVDQAAHEMALACKVPTLAFLPCGIDHIYPDSFLRLKQQVLDEGGAVVSGFPPWDKMTKVFFHQRNRWMVSLADLVLVVESHRGGGSWLSGRLALEQGVSVATVPVHPFSPWGLGNNDLLYCSHTEMVRDGFDLRSLLATAAKYKGEYKEQDIHRPDGHADRDFSTLGDRLGCDVKNPVR